MLWLLRRKYGIGLAYVILALLSVVAWRNIPVELTPDSSLPSINITQSWGRVSPEIMEREITRKLERAAGQVQDVVGLESTSQEGTARVTLQFNKQAPIDIRMVELRDRVRAVLADFPQRLPPTQFRKNVPEELEDFSTFITYSLAGNVHEQELLKWARQHIRLPLSGLSGLSDIRISGVNEPALYVHFDFEQLQRLNLRADLVMAQLAPTLQPNSVSTWQQYGREYSVTLLPDTPLLENMENFPIQLPGTPRQVRLRQIAEVKRGTVKEHSIRRVNGKRTLTVEFVKEQGADAFSLAERIHREIATIKDGLPSGMELRLESDGTENMRQELQTLQNQSQLAIAMVIGVLLLFFWSIRDPLLLGLSIGFSLSLGVLILYLSGQTINLFSLAAITLSFGMLIDNAIIVFEHLRHHLSPNLEVRLVQVTQRLSAIWAPVLGSTLTTVGIFVPLFFALEELRLFLQPIGIALSVMLLSSILISFTWIPYSLIWFYRPKQKKKLRKISFPTRLGLRLLQINRRIRWVWYLTLAGLIGIPLHLIPSPDYRQMAQLGSSEQEPTFWETAQTFYEGFRGDIEPWVGGLWYRFQNEISFSDPWGNSGYETINVRIITPIGTPLEEIDKIATHFEEIAEPYRNALEFYVADMSEFFGASIVYHVKDDFQFKMEPYRLKGEAMYLAARTGNADISVFGFGQGFSNFGGATGTEEIVLTGYSYESLEELAERFKQRLLKNRRVRNVNTNAGRWFERTGLFQFVLKPKEEALFERGLTPAQLFRILGDDINPENVWANVEYDGQKMMLISQNQNISNRIEAFRQRTRKRDSLFFKVNEVAALGKEELQTNIRRKDQNYTRRVEYEFLGPNRLAEDFQKQLLEEVAVPVGMKAERSRFSFLDLSQNKQNLALVFVLCLVCVFLIVSAILESWSLALWVILAIPLGGIGVMTGALYHDLLFGRGAIAGSMLLFGIVVNNSILLMHGYSDMKRRGKRDIRAWYGVLGQKLRPIMLTTITTLMGLVPILLFAENIFWSSLAVVSFWGLAFSTILIVIYLSTIKSKA